MHHSLTRLHHSARAPIRRILGLMSGTSADAVDLALVELEGAGLSTRIASTRTFAAPWPDPLRDAFFSLAYRPDAPLDAVLQLERQLDRFFGECVHSAIRRWSFDAARIDAIALSGQTIFHRGRGEQGGEPVTKQLGDGDALSRLTGIPVVSDFRRTHIAAGYEGAPLVPLAEALLFGGSAEDRLLVNLGGIANLTWLPAANAETQPPPGAVPPDPPTTGAGSTPPTPEAFEAPEPPAVPVPHATDTGPANTLMDRLVRAHRADPPFDLDGQLAAAGRVDPALFEQLRRHPFFSRPLPASTGPEVFNMAWFQRALTASASTPSLPDQLRTLVQLTAWSLHRAIAPLASSPLASGTPPSAPLRVFASGGGARNPVLMRAIAETLAPLRPDLRLETSAPLGVDPDFKEAVMFAVLANERLAGRGWTASEALPDSGKSFTLGRICLPD